MSSFKKVNLKIRYIFLKQENDSSRNIFLIRIFFSLFSLVKIFLLLRTMLMSNLLLCKFRGLYITNQSLVTLDDLHSRFIIGKESSARNGLFID